ncbi:MAG TPA: flavin reductase [Solirubrobacteraceae bacterium]
MTAAAHCDAELFRDVIGHFMTGVTVITTHADGRDHGMSASAVASVSLEPPMLLACLNDQSPTQAAVTHSKVLCVNVLAEEHSPLARQFARPSRDKFAGVAVRRGRMGALLLADALAVLECAVTYDVAAGTHRIFLAAVKHAEARDGTPLAYFRGGFGRVELTADGRAFAMLREAVLHRTLPVDAQLAVADLAERLGLTRPHVHQALLRLEGEGLVTRDGASVFRLVAVDAASSDAAFDARCAIELGAARLTVGSVEGEQLAELRRRMEATRALIHDGRFTDVDGYVSANARFHEHLVGLAGNAALLDVYRRLSIPSLMTRMFMHHDHASDALIADHEALVDAFERGDLDAAIATILTHTQRAKQTNAAAIAAGGGRV